MHLERERACDDLFVNSGFTASAEHLLHVATRVTSSPWTQACGLAMTLRSSLAGRLVTVLCQERNRRALSVVMVTVLLAGGAISVPVATPRAAEHNDATADSQSFDGADAAEVTTDEDIVPEPEASARAPPLPKHTT